MRDLHSLKHSLYHEQLEPPVEREDEDEEESELVSVSVSSTSSPTSPSTSISSSSPSTPPPTPSSNSNSNEQTDEPQLATEESPNSENSSIQNETWTEWLVSLFWKSLGYSYVY